MKASRDSLGKTSTFVRLGLKVDIDRIEKTIRRSRNRRPKAQAKTRPPAKPRAEPEQARALATPNLPSGIECRTPSPEPPAPAKEELSVFDLPTQLVTPDIDYDFTRFEVDDIIQPQLSPHLGVLSPSVSGQLEPFESYQYHDPHVDIIWDCYSTALRKLALAHGRLQSSAEPDSGIQLFRYRNTLLAMLEPIISAQPLRLRELFLHNFSATFSDRPEFPQFAQHVSQAIGVGPTSSDGAAAECLTQEIDTALRKAGIYAQPFTRRLLQANSDQIATDSQSPMSADDKVVAARAESSEAGLSPSMASTSSSSGLEMPITTPTPDHADFGPQLHELEAATFAYHLGEIDTAQTGLRAIAAYDGTVSARGQVLMRLARYCLCYILRQSGRLEDAEGCLIQAVRGSTYFSDTNGTEWEEVSYLFV